MEIVIYNHIIKTIKGENCKNQSTLSQVNTFMASPLLLITEIHSHIFLSSNPLCWYCFGQDYPHISRYSFIKLQHRCNLWSLQKTHSFLLHSISLQQYFSVPIIYPYPFFIIYTDEKTLLNIAVIVNIY